MNKKIFTIIKSLLIVILLLFTASGFAQDVNQDYQKAIVSADAYFDQADYLNAKASYQVASKLKPDEQYPKDKLKESINLLRVQMEEMEVYQEKVSFADQLYDEQSYQNAITAYEEAQKLMPSIPYPSEQITLINTMMANEAQNQARFEELMQTGDVFFAEADYQAARANYEDASNIYPERPEPKDKITATDAKLAEIAAQQSGYEKAISEAEMYHARKDYEKELQSYTLASELKPEDAALQIKIKELNEFLRKYESYNLFVSQGDELYINKLYAEAKVKYELALEVLPDETYPKEIISRINLALTEKTEKDKAAYDEAIAKADALYSQEDYDAAMVAYSDALRFWPDGKHARSRLSSISEMQAMRKAQEEAYLNSITLADKLFANKQYPEAKAEYLKAAGINPFEQYPKVRLEEINMILAEISNKLHQYEMVVEGADKLFNAGDYSESRIQYLKAQEIFSDRSYPADQIKMIDEILGLQRDTRAAYLAAIERGDAHFAAREWEDAKVDYVEASDLIPIEEYPKDKITEINDILAMLKAEQDNYRLALKNADQLYAENDFAAALLEYRKAAEIFSEEEYPQERIAEINDLLADQAALEELESNYLASISSGDQFFSDGDYSQAKAAYQQALALKANETYPAGKISEIESILAEQARLQGIEESYAQAISEADEAFANADYTAAKSAYQRAAGIKIEETYPPEKISEIDGILAEQARLNGIDASYQTAIAKADALLAQNKYEEARAAYLEANAIKESETYPEEKIAEIDATLAALALAAEQLAQLEADYAAAIAEADAFFASEDYDNAKLKYTAALALKPTEAYPASKISEIDGILMGMEQLRILNENYAAAIAAADGYFEDEAYTEARIEYEKAEALKPAEQYPKDKIAEIEGILAEQARLLGIEESYAAAITSADALFNNKQYTEAIVSYSEAARLKAEEEYPKDKITEIDGILAELARMQSIDEAYQQALTTADTFFEAASYAEAKEAYSNASTIKPEEQYPKDKIAEIDATLVALALAAEQQAQLEADYAAAIAEADAFFASEDYDNAKLKYTAALALKPTEAYPTSKISEIDGILMGIEQLRILNENYAAAIATADGYFEDEAYTEARIEYEKAVALKPAEQYPKDKIAEIEGILAEKARLQGIEESYAAAIASADTFFNNKQYTDAKVLYAEASGLKPAEEYPKNKITEIDGILAELARMQSIDEAYQQALTSADTFFEAASYTEAKEAYSNASTIKPEEQYPKDKIAEIEAILAEQARVAALNEDYSIAIGTADGYFAEKQYEEALQAYNRALSLKADEAYPAQKITEINGILANIEQQQLTDDGYANAIALGDNFFSNKDYTNARAEYEKALGFKATEAYPQQKITEIDGILAEAARLQGIEDTYNAAILSADNLFNAGDYTQAKAGYNQALAAKTGDEYAISKVSEIDSILAEMARMEDIETQYAAAISSGDAAFASANYQTAREAYVNALSLKADEPYPTEKISEIDGIFAEQARLLAMQQALDASYAQAISDADEYLDRGAYLDALNTYKEASEIKPNESYPKEKIAEINGRLAELEGERQAAYEAAVAQADTYYDVGNYRSAKEAYETAVSIKPDEKHAQDRLDEVTVLYMAELEVLKVSYRKYIADADNYFNEKIYDGAIENYRKAAAVLRDEEYPGRMISRITQIINDNAITDVNKMAQIILNNTSKKFLFEDLPVNVRKQNYILIKAKNMSDHDFKMLVSFGQNGSKNGGVVLQVPKGENTRDYIVRIGALYKWFSEDNNWLSIYPEGGDIQVALIRISKSD